MKTLAFNISIQSTAANVWNKIISPETYGVWTSAFCTGSYFVGSWEQGETIRFMSPDGGGMVSEIAENRLHEFISIRHLGYIQNGVDDTESPAVKSWAPAYENYQLIEEAGVTVIKVEVQVTEEYIEYMERTFPKALEKLKELSEQ